MVGNSYVLQTKSSRVVKELDEKFQVVTVSPDADVEDTGIEEVFIFDARSKEEIEEVIVETIGEVRKNVN